MREGKEEGKEGKEGEEAKVDVYTSASAILFAFARLFWNQILICVSVMFRLAANSALSAMLR